ncbi:MAG: hypothetical protein IPG99_13685 [Ignavibacteria bacterium]|nr:hypothetical protein [Ignavibacteria bacterium]
MFSIYGGDVDQDGSIDATDLSMIDNDSISLQQVTRKRMSMETGLLMLLMLLSQTTMQRTLWRQLGREENKWELRIKN